MLNPPGLSGEPQKQQEEDAWHPKKQKSTQIVEIAQKVIWFVNMLF